GVWGEHAMSAHPQISKEDAMEIVKYVLSVSTKLEEKKLPQQGALVLNQHLGTGEEGRYILTAAYTDNGGASVPLTTKTTLYLRPSKVQAENADVIYNMQRGDNGLGNIHNGSFFVLKDIDLKEITGVTYRYASRDKAGTIKVRVDSIKGPVISTVDFAATGNRNNFNELATTINDPGGKHDLYFQFVKSDTPNRNLAALDWIRFEGGKEVIEKQKAVAATPKTPVESKTAATGKTAAATKKSIGSGNVLIARSDCKTCHAQNQKLVGPSFVQIATKYKNNSGTVSRLAGKIINGGAGVWGQVPMTAHPQLSAKDAATMVQYILKQKK
ncbi:MAG TPA: carbohydrate-binding protein, partial [Chitinophagaceae bacterium]|nr:carbohydrate-binding protein [Chitinophagaceae bacterium]